MMPMAPAIDCPFYERAFEIMANGQGNESVNRALLRDAGQDPKRKTIGLLVGRNGVQKLLFEYPTRVTNEEIKAAASMMDGCLPKDAVRPSLSDLQSKLTGFRDEQNKQLEEHEKQRLWLERNTTRKLDPNVPWDQLSLHQNGEEVVGSLKPQRLPDLPAGEYQLRVKGVFGYSSTVRLCTCESLSRQPSTDPQCQLVAGVCDQPYKYALPRRNKITTLGGLGLFIGLPLVVLGVGLGLGLGIGLHYRNPDIDLR